MNEGIIRGKPYRTTYGDKAAPFPFDNVNRNIKARAQNRLWVRD
jgi:putative transposase